MGRPQSIFPGERYGRLTVVEYIPSSRNNRVQIVCDCSCGSRHVLHSWRVSKSCGCYAREHPNGFRHGGASTPERTHEYRAWKGMKTRCHNQNVPEFKNYGGRGIRVTDHWLGKRGFSNFLADVGEAPSLKHSLDRFPNNDGNYEPGNIRWATQTEQTRNTRANRMLTLNGVSRCVAEWAEALGINASTLRDRLKEGWTIERALTTQVQIDWVARTQAVKLVTKELVMLRHLGFPREWLANWYGVSSRTIYNVVKAAL